MKTIEVPKHIIYRAAGIAEASIGTLAIGSGIYLHNFPQFFPENNLPAAILLGVAGLTLAYDGIFSTVSGTFKLLPLKIDLLMTSDKLRRKFIKQQINSMMRSRSKNIRLEI